MIVAYLLDTNVVSQARRRRPDPGVEAWARTVSDGSLFISALTIGELRLWSESLAARGDRAQADIISEFVEGIREGYGERIIPVDARIAEQWARWSVPDRIPVVDGLLAATAFVNGWTLVTRNVKDVRRPGLSVLNPFREGSSPAPADDR